jgi:hypothetical protein
MEYTAEIYKWGLSDCSNNGISSKFKDVIICEEDLLPENCPDNGVYLVKRMLGGKPYYHFVPCKLKNDKTWTMAGGTWIYSCDSRFPFVDDCPHINHPIALHDRVEPFQK